MARLLTALMLALLALPAGAACEGRDLMAALAREDPAAHAAILARAAAVENGTGRFWRIARDGRAPSHLFGTVHSTEAAARPLPVAVASALDGARVLMVELTPQEQARLARRMAGDATFVLDPDGPTLSQRLSPAGERLAAKVLGARGLPMAVAERLRPALLLAVLSVPACERTALESGAEVLDQAIMSRAERAGIPIHGLETHEESFAAFDRLPEDALTDLLVDALAAAEAEEDLRRTLQTLYDRGEIAAIMEFNIWYSENMAAIGDSRGAADALDRALIVERNRAWLAGLRRALDRGGAFVAVGALHLPGPEGLIALLRADGYAVTRVALD